ILESDPYLPLPDRSGIHASQIGRATGDRDPSLESPQRYEWRHAAILGSLREVRFPPQHVIPQSVMATTSPVVRLSKEDCSSDWKSIPSIRSDSFTRRALCWSPMMHLHGTPT